MHIQINSANVLIISENSEELEFANDDTLAILSKIAMRLKKRK